MSLGSPALAGEFFTTIATWELIPDDAKDNFMGKFLMMTKLIPNIKKMTINQDNFHTFHLDGKQFRYPTSLWFMFLHHFFKIFGINLVVRTLPMKLSFVSSQLVDLELFLIIQLGLPVKSGMILLMKANL